MTLYEIYVTLNDAFMTLDDTNDTTDISQVQWRPDHRPAGEVDPAAGHDGLCAQVYRQVMSSHYDISYSYDLCLWVS